MKIICIGRNYTEHIRELGNDRPEAPVVFLKPDTAILKDNQPFYYPDFSNDIHHEVELLIRIKKEGKSIDAAFAHQYYDEIGLGIDFTARDLQKQAKEKGLPWERAKAFNHSAVLSRFVPKNEYNLANCHFRLEKNGEIVQQGNTEQMIWPIDELIADISKFIQLKTGDIIFTGTPSGVGPVEIGDVLCGFLEDQPMFEFEIK
jgi:2-keto-4-pentenoate hydratase/2-oxohepta-3-ene-1,7-dioic acid hydratase in catechol pathway